MKKYPKMFLLYIIGFHTWDYARHFLSCCSRIFGIDYVAKKGTVSVEYFGRSIAIRWKPIGKILYNSSIRMHK